jgi:hypothetical protein
VATYNGICEEVPLGYVRLETSLGQDPDVKFWEKTKIHPVRTNPLEATPAIGKLLFMADAVRRIF